MCLFLTNIEIPIVTTSIVGITNDLQGFSQSSWIVSAYLLGYVGRESRCDEKREESADGGYTGDRLPYRLGKAQRYFRSEDVPSRRCISLPHILCRLRRGPDNHTAVSQASKAF